MEGSPNTLKPKRGGRRDGAGRPKGATSVHPQWRRLRMSCRLPKYMVDWLREQDLGVGTLIQNALEAYQIPHPDPEPK